MTSTRRKSRRIARPEQALPANSVDSRGCVVFKTLGVFVFLFAVIPASFIFLEIVTPWPVTRFVETICGPICHHFPGRTIILDKPMVVCARCAGLYCGWLVAVAVFYRVFLTTVERKFATTKNLLGSLAVLFAASALEAGLEAGGFVELPNWPRFLFGLPLGLLPASVLLIGAKILVAESRRLNSMTPRVLA